MNVELMLKVKERVLAEPDRVDMKWWQANHRDTIPQKLHLTECNTSCCIAGHAIEVCGGMVPDGTTLPGTIAKELLGLKHAESELIFHLHRLSEGYNAPGTPYRDLALRLKMFKPRTKQYAEVVAQAIDRCIERNGGLKPAPDVVVDEDKRVAAEMGISL